MRTIIAIPHRAVVKMKWNNHGRHLEMQVSMKVLHLNYFLPSLQQVSEASFATLTLWMRKLRFLTQLLISPSLHEVAVKRDISVVLEWGWDPLKREKKNIWSRIILQDHITEPLIMGLPLAEENLGVPSPWTPISHLLLTLYQACITTVVQDSSRITRNIVREFFQKESSLYKWSKWN